MNPISKFILPVATSALALTLTSVSTAPPGAVGPGDTPQYTWRTALVNGMGLSSLDDLRGKPVLFDFWGIH